MAWKLSQSSLCSTLYIAPGNAGTAQCGQNVALSITDFAGIEQFCETNAVAMIVVGPEEPLVKGIHDYFDQKKSSLIIIGPSREGAKLEGSKAFAKAFMQRHNIPTAAYAEFDAGSYEAGVAYLKQHALPIVLKADGLAAGKGVLICQSHEEALIEFEQMIRQEKFGEASRKVVVEAFLDGIELSVFALTDGKDYVLLPAAKDYKRIGEGDTGLNTGGMGAVSPVPFANAAFLDKVEATIIRPTIDGLYKENIPYKGFVFFGLIKVNGEPFVIEYNCRMGDPETEVVLPRLKNDLVHLFVATGNNQLKDIDIEQDPRVVCTVVAVSGGYPGDYKKGLPISGLEAVKDGGSLVFHAGTTQTNDAVVTNGGRVLCVTSFGETVAAAVDQSKQVLKEIHFEEMYYRNDIGYEFIEA